MTLGYQSEQHTREQVDALAGPTVVQFGANWCGFCRAAEQFTRPALGERPGVRHLKVADGKGRPLGRSFRVKLWPTLVFLRDGAEVARVVRPTGRAEIDEALALLDDAQVSPAE